ncbi:MAG: DUF1617 family protein [Lactococcus lactis]|jgi:hypothetical protein|uniref:DUF1617 family protein n=1 Tax=Lactococcus lactis TaxID=1358 RepID=UPI0026533574|nr:DUF1617 family protein [Lactococcus lactis]MDN6255145.1 DUF1617 family protein [Tetragenococcus koreensis]MDN5615812.1 DUF1617 family protein [Lactococcus lactis]MDN5981375.1 DUF1617 family protein [Lactococcus lactis]MDN5994194.1 DUF1617 family protein [Lactococcus lactis]
MLSLKNKELAPIINFLSAVELSPKASRCRSKLVKKLLEKHTELKEDLEDIIEKFGKRDDKGEIIRLENGNVEFSEDTKEEGVKEQEELFDEEISINLDEIKNKVKFLVTNLDQLDTKLSGYDAEIYDMLMDKLEEEI